MSKSCNRRSGSAVLRPLHMPDHGGQVSFPLIGAAVVPSDFGQKYTAGHVYENGHHLFVTTGIGTSIMPVRFRVPPEIAVLTIVSEARP
jgi:predicted MPP superfamily phosphohydrolase